MHAHSHRIALELFTEIGFAHVGLLASNLGKKASTNLGAIYLVWFAPDAVRFAEPPLIMYQMGRAGNAHATI